MTKKKKQSPRYQAERMIQRLIEQQGVQLNETDRELLAVGRSLIEQLDAFRAELAQSRHAVNVLTQQLSQTNATVQTQIFWKLITERDEMKNELLLARQQPPAPTPKRPRMARDGESLTHPTESTLAGVYCPATEDHVCRRSDCVGSICMEAGK